MFSCCVCVCVLSYTRAIYSGREYKYRRFIGVCTPRFIYLWINWLYRAYRRTCADAAVAGCFYYWFGVQKCIKSVAVLFDSRKRQKEKEREGEKRVTRNLFVFM